MKSIKVPSSSHAPKLPHSPAAPHLPREQGRPHLFRPTPIKASPPPKQPPEAHASKAPKTTAAQWSETPPNDWSQPSDAWQK